MMQAPVMPDAPAMQALPLRDIKLPAEPGFWPLAPGWWLLLIVVLLLLSWAVLKWYRYIQQKRRWQVIDEQFSAIEFNYQKNHDRQQLLSDVSAFLRRFVKYQMHQKTATSLAGQAWIDYLNQLQEGEPFTPYADALTEGAFQHSFKFDAEGLLCTTRAFIRQHVLKPPKQERNDA